VESVNIVGVGMTKFGNLEDSITDLAQKAGMEALSDSSNMDTPIDHMLVGSHIPEVFTGLSNLSTILADALGVVPAGATRIETGPSSGSSAFEAGVSLISSGLADIVLVLGVEKMSGVPRDTVSNIIARMLSEKDEIRYGTTPTALAALVTRRYMHDYGLTRDELSLIPIKAHRNGAKNPLAHFQKEVTIEEVNTSPIIADPLRLYDCCATSDGAAALVLASDKAVREHSFSDNVVKVLGVGHGTDYLALQHRTSLTSFNATRVASRNAFRMSGIKPSDVDVCEIHDAFSILELLNMEDIGLVEKGQAARAVEDGITEVSGSIPINPTGGLKARGHPTGATGVAQIRDIVLQLRGKAPRDLQVKDSVIGLSHNIGGFGNNVVVGLFSNEK